MNAPFASEALLGRILDSFEGPKKVLIAAVGKLDTIIAALVAANGADAAVLSERARSSRA